MYHAHCGMDWREDPEKFTRWILEQKEIRWVSNSWRVFRASLCFFLKEQGAPIEAIDVLFTKDIPTKKKQKVARKKLDMADALKIEAVLLNPRWYGLNSSAYDKMLRLFIMTNIRIGLRPTEWEKLSVVAHEGSPAILAVNAKTTGGRGNGYARVSNIDEATAKLALEAIAERDMLYSIGVTWRQIQNSMSVRIIRIREAAAVKDVSLYSSRHQCAADLKSAGKTLREIADHMGHASDETATKHYGKRRSGVGATVIEKSRGLSMEEAQSIVDLNQNGNDLSVPNNTLTEKLLKTVS